MEDRRSKYQPKRATPNQSDYKLDIKFDITELDLLCAYVVSDNRSINRTGINNIKRVFDMMNMDFYKDNPQSMNRVHFIMKGAEARLVKNLQGRDLIIRDILGGMGVGLEVPALRELSNTEIQWINNNVSSILKYSYLQAESASAIDLFTKLNSSDYSTRGKVAESLEELVGRIQTNIRRSKIENAESIRFSLRPEECESALRETYRQVTSKNNILTFGTQAFNLLTGGGVQSTRVYVLLGLPGERKSSTLLEMAIQIKKYNKGYVCADPTKRPCIVLFSMENSVKETIERMYSMTMLHHMEEFSENDAVTQFLNGGLHLTDDDPIDLIILFRPNFSEDTSYMYEIIDNLADEGYEVICMIQDYAMRIKSVDHYSNNEMRFQLGAVINEFKTLATLKNIPVISASQLNRDAATNIDNARLRNKNDLVRLLGRSNVAESTMILNNSDWVATVAPEMNMDGTTYLGMKLLKHRYHIPGDVNCAFIPYIGDTLKLTEDLGLPPCHKTSLVSEEFMTMQLNNGMSANVYGAGNARSFVEVDEGTFDTTADSIFTNASGFVARELTTQVMQLNTMRRKQNLYKVIRP